MTPDPPPSAPWGYAEHDGPEHWCGLDAAYGTCGSGTEQSPIDLSAAGAVFDAALPALTFAYGRASPDVEREGRTVFAHFGSDAASVTVGAERHGLVQLHFHTPAEHVVAGRGPVAELHLVHAVEGGALTVVGVHLILGRAHGELERLFDATPEARGQRAPLSDLDLDTLLPTDRASWRYAGSLTTPPCSEGVSWIVLTEPIEISADQLARLQASSAPQGNRRPVQPCNGRTVRTDRPT